MKSLTGKTALIFGSELYESPSFFAVVFSYAISWKVVIQRELLKSCICSVYPTGREVLQYL